MDVVRQTILNDKKQCRFEVRHNIENFYEFTEDELEEQKIQCRIYNLKSMIHRSIFEEKLLE